jgi:glycosyltransferase involved in cell wall biosynthesis
MTYSSISRSPRPVRVLTNIWGLLKFSDEDLELHPWPAPTGGLAARASAVWRSFRFDYVFMDGLSTDFFLLAMLKRLLPFYKPRLVLLNLLSTAPIGRVRTAKFRVLAWLLGGAWKIIQYHRDTRELQRYLRLPPTRFDYIPFKINQRELVQQTIPSDGGYIFCGGKTRRDFDTFIAAVSALPYPVKIVTTSNKDIAMHGSYLADRPLPPHIEIVRLDGSARPFIELLARSRLVVLPIKPDICGVGIGVYIMAMALKKCVIISEGPSTTEDLSDSLAVIVPPGDVEALRSAIDRVYRDDALRLKLEQNGFVHATALGGEERLYSSIVAWLRNDSKCEAPGVA